MAQQEDIEMGRVGSSKPPKGPPDDTEYKPVDWKRVFLSWKYIPWWILLILIGVATAMLTIKHDQVVEHLRPWAENFRDLPAGWLIPIVILIVISFPPLFGHEIVAVLCGVVWGLWIGFAIVAAGTFIGEIGTWFAFKYTLRRKAAKLERTNLNYGALARLTRDGGFWVVLVIRLSAIPAHFSTAVFSTCDVNFWSFCFATALSLPKQIFLVYLGVLLVAKEDGSKVQTIIFCCVFLVTMVMAVWIWWKMKNIKAMLLAEQEARKEARRQEDEKEALATRQEEWVSGPSQQNDMDRPLLPSYPSATARPWI